MRKVLYLLGVLNDSDVDWIMANGKRKDFDAGSVIVEAQKPLVEIYIVLQGELSVRLNEQDDRQVAVLYSGEIIGELSFLDRRPPNASVFATTDVALISLSRSGLQAKLDRDPGFASRFYKSLGSFLAVRLRQTTGQLGYGADDGASVMDHEDVEDELDPELLDRTAVAGQYFDMLKEHFGVM